MTMPGKGALGVVAALVVAVVAGGILSRSLLHSDAAPARATEARVLVLFNQERAERGLKPLKIDAKLREAANSHSDDMLRRGYFSHDGPHEKWDVRVRRYVTRSVVAEILSQGSGFYATPKGMLKAWMNSPAHKRIILTPELRLVGLGVATGTYDGQKDVAMATADFSTSASGGG
jgi:uncharacterized protein YkwD